MEPTAGYMTDIYVGSTLYSYNYVTTMKLITYHNKS